jgi:hypothetical protein
MPRPIVAAHTGLPTLQLLASLHAAVEKFPRKNGRSIHTHIRVRAFIFLILPVFPCAWSTKSASSDPGVMLNRLVLK